MPPPRREMSPSQTRRRGQTPSRRCCQTCQGCTCPPWRRRGWEGATGTRRKTHRRARAPTPVVPTPDDGVKTHEWQPCPATARCPQLSTRAALADETEAGRERVNDEGWARADPTSKGKPPSPIASVGRSEHSIADASRTARQVFAVEEEDARDEGWVNGWVP